MVTRRSWSVWLVLCCAVCAAHGDEARRHSPPFTVSKATTYFVGPLDRDGYVDYVAAVNEHFGRGVTPEKNANVLYWRATGPMSEGAAVPPGLFKLLAMERPPKDGHYYLSLARFLTQVAKIDAGDPRFTKAVGDELRHATSKPWHEGMFPHLGMWLTFNAAPLATIVEGTKRPTSYAPLFHPRDPDRAEALADTILYGTQDRREFGRALAARAMLRLADGRSEAAWSDLQACHRLARHAASGPWLIEHLVGLAIDGGASAGDLSFLRHSELTAAQAEAYLEDQRSLPSWPSLADRVEVTERVLFLDLVQLLARHGRAGLDVILPAFEERSPPDWLDKLHFEEIDWDVAFKSGNRWYDRYVETLRLKDRQKALKAGEELDKEFATTNASTVSRSSPNDARTREALSQRLGDYLFGLSRSALVAVRTAELRGAQSRQNVQIALALAAHRAATGRYPAKLAELSPRYFKQVPEDLFSGQPLLYSAADNAYLLYSVGPNGKDDAARGPGDSPPGDDLVVRMPGAD